MQWPQAWGHRAGERPQESGPRLPAQRPGSPGPGCVHHPHKSSLHTRPEPQASGKQGSLCPPPGAQLGPALPSPLSKPPAAPAENSDPAASGESPLSARPSHTVAQEPPPRGDLWPTRQMPCEQGNSAEHGRQSPHLVRGHAPQAVTALKKHGAVTDAGVTTPRGHEGVSEEGRVGRACPPRQGPGALLTRALSGGSA